MADLKTSLVLTLKDRLTAPAKRIKRTFEEVANAARLKGRLRLLGRQARNVRRQFKGLRSEAGKLAKRTAGIGIAAGAALAGMLRLVNGSARAGDSIAKTARKMGVGVEELQQWRFAADRSGIATQAFDNSLQRFTRNAREAADGTGTARGAFKFLNIELKDGQGNLRDRTELLDEVGEAMRNIEDPALRMRVAFKLFGREGVDMVNLLSEGKDGMQALRKEALDLGVITAENAARSEQYVDQLTNFMQVIGSLKDAVVGELMPGMTEWLRTQTELIKGGKQNFLGELVNTIRSSVRSIVNFVRGANDIAQSLGGWKVVITSLIALMGIKFVASLVLTMSTLVQMGRTAFPIVLAGLKALKASLLTNPITAIILGIAVAAFLIIKHWTPIKGFFKKLWGDVKAMFDDGFLKGIVRLIAAFNPVALFMRAFDGVLQYFAGISLSDVGGMIMDSLRDGMEFAFNGVVNWFRGKLTGFLNIIPRSLQSRLGLDNLTATLNAQTGAAGNGPLPNQRVNAEVGGTLKIKIDAEGRPRVQGMEKRGGMDIEATTGVIMQGAV